MCWNGQRVLLEYLFLQRRNRSDDLPVIVRCEGCCSGHVRNATDPYERRRLLRPALRRSSGSPANWSAAPR
jgi:hypothetical protein